MHVGVVLVVVQDAGDIVLGSDQQGGIVQIQNGLEVLVLDGVHLCQLLVHDLLIQNALNLQAQSFQLVVDIAGLETVITDDVGSGLVPHVTGLNDSGQADVAVTGQALCIENSNVLGNQLQVDADFRGSLLDVLAQLKDRYPMAVVSNKPDSAVKPLCNQYFPGLYARGEISGCPRKPAPDMVWAAMESIGVDTCIYVGDSEVDVETAKNANVRCLSVLWGFRDRNILEQAGAAYFCEKTSELIAKLDEMVVLCNG